MDGLHQQQRAVNSTAAGDDFKSDPPTADEILGHIQQRIGHFESSGVIEQALRESPASRALRKHSDEFKPRIEHVTENVYVAIGYGLANVVIVYTDEGLILFDTLENPNNMRRVMKDWNELRQRDFHHAPSLPLNHTASSVIAIVYSHFHTDHVFGASAVYNPGVTQIWAHETTDIEISRVFKLTAGTTYKRSMRQFGSLLSEEDGYINAGIGQHLDYDASEVTTAIRPTHIWKGDRRIVQIAGEQLELIHAPGESKDQSIVWMPNKRLLFGADNIYKSFPNIYAIRGTESRDAMIWVKSLDSMRKLKAEFLVLGHSGVLRGRESIYSTVTAYRDAIQFVHDQTVRYMNKGYSVDDIVQIIQLPPHLSDHPYLQQYYGTVDSSVRAVFHHYLGWFSGLPEELRPLPRNVKAAKMAQLVGGRIQLLQQSLEALESNEYQWALELASYSQLLSPTCEVTRRIKAAALRVLSSMQSSTPVRNWYLTTARETEEEMGSRKTSNSSAIVRPRIHEKLKISKSQKNQCIRNLQTAAETLDFIPLRIRAEDAMNMESVLAFTFTDTQEFACIHFRRGIAHVAGKCEQHADIHVHTDDPTWRALLTYELQPLVAVATGKLRIDSYNPLDYVRLKKVFSVIEIDAE